MWIVEQSGHDAYLSRQSTTILPNFFAYSTQKDCGPSRISTSFTLTATHHYPTPTIRKRLLEHVTK